MAQAVNPSFPTARLNGTNPLGPSKHDQRSEHDAHDVRREHGGYDDRSEQDLRREQDERNEQGLRRDHDGRSEHDERERSTDRSRPATSTSSGDAFGPVLAAWGQAYASMFELAADMMKLQQRTFASMIAAADTHAERTADGEQRGRVLQGASASRPDSDSDHLEHDRR
jgi:hypothetical protein